MLWELAPNGCLSDVQIQSRPFVSSISLKWLVQMLNYSSLSSILCILIICKKEVNVTNNTILQWNQNKMCVTMVL